MQVSFHPQLQRHNRIQRQQIAEEEAVAAHVLKVPLYLKLVVESTSFRIVASEKSFSISHISPLHSPYSVTQFSICLVGAGKSASRRHHFFHHSNTTTTTTKTTTTLTTSWEFTVHTKDKIDTNFLERWCIGIIVPFYYSRWLLVHAL
jgi:hypothetical protein